MFFSKRLLSIYIIDCPEAIEIGFRKMFLATIPYFLVGIMEQFAALLNGLGKASVSAINGFVGTCVLRVIWVFAILPLFWNFYMLNAVYVISWVITISLHIISFFIIRKKAFDSMYNEVFV